ncbi:MAG: nucleotidyltransferase domain-containing protein [Saprospiraceae bacterium]
MGLIETYKKQILRLCELYKVKSLYSFGSVNSKLFTENSDVDLMVDFNTDDPLEYTDNYFQLKFELEKILKRSIDLLENKAIKNPFLRENIDKSKVLIYGR